MAFVNIVEIKAYVLLIW